MSNSLGDVPVAGVGSAFFAPTQKDTTWTESFVHTVNPSSAINDSAINFEIPKLFSDWFLFYNRMRVRLDLKLVDNEGNKAEDNFTVAPINGFGQTMFASVKLFLNETQVSGASDGLYPYWAYVSHLLNNGSDKKKSALQLYGYYEDTAPGWDFLSAVVPTDGAFQRRGLFGEVEQDAGSTSSVFKYEGNTVTIFSDVFTDLKHCETPMLSMVGARLEMVLHPPTFYLTCNKAEVDQAIAKGYKLAISSAELLIPAKKLAPTLLLNLEKTLETKNIDYPCNRVDLRKLSLPTGQETFTFDDVKQSQICPDRITFFLVSSYRIEGKYGFSPLRACQFIAPGQAGAGPDFSKRVYLTNMRLALNNESLENSTAPNSKDSLAKRKYYDLMQNLGYLHSDVGLPISFTEFVEGKFFCTYDLTRSKTVAETGSVRQETKQGNLKLELTFERDLPNTAFLFVMSEYHSKISIDKNRNVTYHYLN